MATTDVETSDEQCRASCGGDEWVAPQGGRFVEPCGDVALASNEEDFNLVTDAMGYAKPACCETDRGATFRVDELDLGVRWASIERDHAAVDHERVGDPIVH